jgi:hypothetical protein
MVGVIVNDAVRLADLLAGLSLISDHGLGLPPDDAVRSCLVATELARKLGLGDAEVTAVLYGSLLEHVGCLGYAHETFLVWGDDLAANRAAQRTNFAKPRELLTAYLPSLLRDLDGWERARAGVHMVTQGPGFLKRFANALVRSGGPHGAQTWSAAGRPAESASVRRMVERQGRAARARR